MIGFIHRLDDAGSSVAGAGETQGHAQSLAGFLLLSLVRTSAKSLKQ
jgi:hypothetical protein